MKVFHGSLGAASGAAHPPSTESQGLPRPLPQQRTCQPSAMPRRSALLAALLAISLSSVGCANFNSIHRQFDTQRQKIVAIDAKQRVVTVNRNNTRSVDETGSFSDHTQAVAPATGARLTEICVEQSPDVFSFLSSSGSLSVEAKAAAVALAMAMAESGGSMGFRTQVTQAQSNLLYALCQFHANGVVSDKVVRTELRRFQNTLLGALAIEQLTSPRSAAPTPKPVESSDTKAGVAAITKALEELSASEKQLRASRDALKLEEEKLAKTPKEPKEAYDAQQAKVGEATKDVGTKEEAVKAKRTAVDAATVAAAKPAEAKPDAEKQAAITMDSGVPGAVVASLEIVLNRGVLIDNCVEYMFEDTPTTRRWSYPGDTKSGDPLYGLCARTIETYLRVWEKNAALLAPNRKGTPGIVRPSPSAATPFMPSPPPPPAPAQ